LFAAIYPPASVVEHLLTFVSELRVGNATVNTRLTRAETLHVTVAFLGDVPEERQPDVEAAMAHAVGAVEPPGPVRLAGGGRFGRGKFTVLWVGVHGDLRPLARAVRRDLKRARLPYDDRPWKPHLTLARPGDRLGPDDLAADRAALAGYEGPSWPATEVVLVRSHLGPKPTYDRLAAWPLPA
jgi:2'-5' RNA ligase